MSEHKRFKAFRSELNESEYKETLTGYPNRGIDTDVGAVKHDADTLQKINGVLAALGRYTYQHTAEAMIKIRTRLNLFMIDFPWTPWMWQSNPTGTFTLNATLFGRVDGVDGMSGNIRFDGKASPTAGMKEFALVVTVEPAEDGFYRVNAKLQPQIAVMPEGVEHDGDTISEMAQTPERVKEMQGKLDTVASKIRNKVGDQPAAKKKYNSILSKDRNEFFAKKMYGKGGKIVKGKRKPVKEEVVDEALIGGQKKLDVNKNKRLDSQDFKLLRAKKKKPMQEQEQKKPWWMTSTAAELAAAAQSASNARKGEEAESRKRHAQQNRRMKWTLADKAQGKKTVKEAAMDKPKKMIPVTKIKDGKKVSTKLISAYTPKKAVKEYTEMMGGIPLTAPDPTAAMADKSGKGKRFHKGAIKSVAEAVAKGKKAKKTSPHQGAANVIGKQKAIKSTLQKHDMRW